MLTGERFRHILARAETPPIEKAAFYFTLIVQAAEKPPSSVVTVIVAVPEPTAVTIPYSLTFRMLVLLEDQVTPWFVAFHGLTVARSSSLPPRLKLAVVMFRLTPVTETLLL